MAGHLKNQISAFGRALFLKFLKQQGLHCKEKDRLILAQHIAYKVMTKPHTQYSPRGVMHDVTGINEEDLATFESKCEHLAMKGALVFVDVKLGNIKVVTLDKWNEMQVLQDIHYPVTHNSAIGGRILYKEISMLPTKYKLTGAQLNELRKLHSKNKTSKIQQDLFL